MLGYAHDDDYLGSIREIRDVDESSSAFDVEGDYSGAPSQPYADSCDLADRGEVTSSLPQDRSPSWSEINQKERLIYSRNSPIIELKGVTYG